MHLQVQNNTYVIQIWLTLAQGTPSYQILSSKVKPIISYATEHERVL
jgi:hypothetical protein